ncbi:MAG TPA: hypothetical protein VGI81_24925 [Tepidisphaeraceae bacterium]|jgi:hypothetical protein
MNTSLVDRIAAAVLYEGYLLYPYRPSVKTRHRWTFGGLLPRRWCEAERAGDRWAMECECLVQGTDATTIEAAARFLHLIERTSAEMVCPVDYGSHDEESAAQPAESTGQFPKRPEAWQEGMERRVELPAVTLGSLRAQPHLHEFLFPDARHEDPLVDADHNVIGIVVRDQHAIEGAIELSAEPVEGAAGTWKLHLSVTNLTPIPAGVRLTRDKAMMRSLISTHAIVVARDGAFVSLTDPPDHLKSVAAACRNVGAWPVLVGQPGERDAMLCSPIILPDYPQIAPESPGDLFDGTEIDEILSLRILALTDEEKRAAAETDERARRILERTESLAREQLMGLHGTFRNPPEQDVQSLGISGGPPLFPSPGTPGEGKGGGLPDGLSSTHPLPIPPPAYRGWEEDPPGTSRSGLTSVRTDGGEVRVGDRVRLHPLGRADPFDMLLAGKTATVIAIEQDYEDQVLLAVTIDDDPGRDLGHEGKPAHRFFFRPEEAERLSSEPNGAKNGNATTPV